MLSEAKHLIFASSYMPGVSSNRPDLPRPLKARGSNLEAFCNTPAFNS